MLPTNSIIIANLPDWSTNTSNIDRVGPSDHTETLPLTFLHSLRAVIEVHRKIVHWVPVRRFRVYFSLVLTASFRRVFCVFTNENDAEAVKYALNGCIFEGHRLDVYFGEVDSFALFNLADSRILL